MRFHRHKWGPHPCFKMDCVRRCSVCLRVEEKCFLSTRWKRVEHLSGLTDARTLAFRWQRSMARELNEQMQRLANPRAIW